jgi:chaperonin GroES
MRSPGGQILSLLKTAVVHIPTLWFLQGKLAASNAASNELCQKEAAMNIRPLHDRLIVQRIAEEEMTKGGIIIPDTAKEKPIEGKVIAVGNGKIMEDGKTMPLEVKKGDRILFGKYSGTEIKIEGEEHLILREDEVLGIIEK